MIRLAPGLKLGLALFAAAFVVAALALYGAAFFVD